MTTQQILQLNDQQYHDLLFNKYLKWCGNQAHDQIDLQCLVASSRIWNFFKFNIDGMSQDFIKEAQPYLSLNNPAAMLKLWEKTTARIFYYYSPPLTIRARKVSIINKITRNDLNSITT